MRERNSDCTLFEALLPDAAFDPRAAPEVAAHALSCARCERELEHYRTTARALATAFAGAAALLPAAGRPAAPRRRAAALLAASALLGAAFALSGSPPVNAAHLVVHAEDGAQVHRIGPRRVRLEEGVSTFEVRNGESVVETPFGTISCRDCQFTVELGACGPPAASPACCMTLTVASGIVGTNASDSLLLVRAGQSLTWPGGVTSMLAPH